MYLDVFSDNSFETNCWLLGTDGTNEAVVVDPGFSPERVHAMLDAEGKRPVAAFATHGHFDHIGSAAAFCGDDLPFYIHEADVAALTDPQGWGAGLQTPPVPVKDVRTVVDGDLLTFAGFEIQVIHTPGHTPGSVSFHHTASQALFDGDTLFPGGPGSTGDELGDFELIIASIRERILPMPPQTTVHPGHGDSTTVGEEAPHLEEWIARGW